MKLSLSRSRAVDRMEERERRYPFYTAIDLALHWLLGLAVLVFAFGLLGIIVANSSPEIYSQATNYARHIFS
ncbi:hypothetical protein EON80_22700 [bacterium]|nr:MAG: hypothetical protein EON80_22700 [bacterium]